MQSSIATLLVWYSCLEQEKMMSLIPAQTMPCEEEAKLVEELKKACIGFRVQDSPANF